MPANSVLAIDRDRAVSQEAKKPAAPVAEEVPPLQVAAKVASKLAGVSTPTWWRLHAAGKVPAPVKLGGRTLWRVEELRSWIESGCPDRRTWEALRAAQRNGRPV